ncbi:MAG: hypothetical protein MI867_16675, partial [Pseudomonadales bacterium]|nr:hypothetical protein [Pseudomonadales bacterium]
GNDIGDGPEDSVFTYMQMGGAVQYAYPIGNNKLVGDYGSRTAVTVRYEQDAATDLDGHYVAFQLDAPKHQYGCFLANLSSSKVPIVPEGAAWNGDCF